MKKILIGGAGITGAVAASMIRKNIASACKLTIWDKARGTGGRMCTSRFNNGVASVDLGAQYISSNPGHFASNKSIYDDLLSGRVIEPLSGMIDGDKTHPVGTQHFISPTGIGSVVKHFLQLSGAELKFGHHINEIIEKDFGFLARTEGGEEEWFDVVILTMPVPQIMNIKGSVWQNIDSNPVVGENLRNVRYSSRFALGLFYEPGATVDVPWVAKYIKGNPVIVFVSLDSEKRNQGSDAGGLSVLAHASVPFSLQHIDEDKETICREFLLPQVRAILPGLPEPSEIKCHKWRYSQVHVGYDGSPGAILLQDKPLMLIGGDALCNSGFDRCIESARAICDIVTETLTS